MTTVSQNPMRCPYFDCGEDICTASFSAITVTGRKIFTFCGTEDYDLCPLFLSKVLRNSRPHGCGRQIRELAFK